MKVKEYLFTDNEVQALIYALDFYYFEVVKKKDLSKVQSKAAINMYKAVKPLLDQFREDLIKLNK